jgi:Putative Flp pilus-assembly TadE/G-like
MHLGDGWWGRTDGQTLPVIVVFMFALLGICAVAIDTGAWFQARRQAQAAADASALAGASQISTGQWSSTANLYFTKNAKPGESVVVQNVTNLAPNDSVQATVSYEAPTYFAQIFGIKTVHVEATARATVESFHSETAGVVPFAVASSCVQVGAQASIYGGTCGTSSSNAGAIQLPAAGVTAGTDCTYATAGSGEAQLDGIMHGTIQTGTLQVGSCISKSKTGNGPQPGVNLDQSPWVSMSWPVTVLIPVIQDPFGNGTNAQATVVAFVYFSITGCSGGSGPGSCSGNGGKEIDGVFTGYDSNNPSGSPEASYISGYGNSVSLTQ